MKKIIIKNLAGIQTHGAVMDDPTEWIALCVAQNAWGKPERVVLHKDELGAEPYDDADVLEEIQVELQPAIDAVLDDQGVEVSPAVPAVIQKQVKLKAEYTVEIEDITAEHELQQVIAKRKAEYPSAEEFLNAYFDGGDEAVAELQAKRLSIKAKYPKP
jgi:hypothetical protein